MAERLPGKFRVDGLRAEWLYEPDPDPQTGQRLYYHVPCLTMSETRSWDPVNGLNDYARRWNLTPRPGSGR